MSFPPGTEMFQFPGFASAAYGFSGGYPRRRGWVAPFGNPGITACSRLPRACRSVPRPSSPLGAKASTRCPCFPRPPQRQAPLPLPQERGPGVAGPRPEASASTSTSHTHAARRAPERKDQEESAAGLASARPTRAARVAPRAPEGTGLRRHHHTMCKEHAAGSAGPRHRATPERGTWWAWADLNGRPHAYQACALTS